MTMAKVRTALEEAGYPRYGLHAGPTVDRSELGGQASKATLDLEMEAGEVAGREMTLVLGKLSGRPRCTAARGSGESARLSGRGCPG